MRNVPVLLLAALGLALAVVVAATPAKPQSTLYEGPDTSYSCLHPGGWRRDTTPPKRLPEVDRPVIGLTYGTAR